MRMEKGFTLVELLITSILLVVILAALIGLYATHHQFYTIASIFTELRGYTKNFKNQITKDIEEAVEVVSSKTLLGTLYTTGDDELVLKCYATTASGFDTNYYDYIAYRKIGTDIKRVVDADDDNSLRGDSSRIFIKNVDDVDFDYYDSSENDSSADISSTTRIEINLEVKKAWAGIERKETIRASARLRNKR